jgi:ankyrin repeat protein
LSFFLFVMSAQDATLAQQLEAAILAGDEAGLVRFLREIVSEHGADLDPVLHSALFKAVRRGRSVETCRLLWKTLSPRGKQKYFVSDTVSCKRPLHVAVEKNHFAIVRLLVEECHFNINQKDCVGDTPLCCARYSGEALNRYLLENGAHVNRGGTMEGRGTPTFGPLWFAVNDGNRVLVDLLLEHGADPNFNRRMPATNEYNYRNRQEHSRTTDMAIQHGDAELLATLIQHGAYVGSFYCIRYVTDRYTSANMLLRDHLKNLEVKLAVCRILVEHAERDRATAVYLKASFDIAIKEAEIEHCRILLDAGLDRISAMYWAIQAGNEAVCRLLVHQYQVDPFAAQESNERSVGENETARTAAASSPFLAAARLQDTAILKFFMQLWGEGYASSAGRNDNGEYPIHVLCRDKHLSLQALGLLMGEECDQADTLIIADAIEHFLPLLSAALSDASLDVIYYLLQQCPDALKS